MKKTILSIAASALFVAASMGAGHALAQSNTITNEVRIMSNTAAFAAVNGAGTSLSDVATRVGATANGVIGLTPSIASLKGDIAGYSDIKAYNVATENGVGSAGGRVWTDARVHGDLGLTIPTGSGGVNLDVEGGMRDPVRNGSDVTVLATTKQDGVVSALYNAGGDVKLTMSSGPATGGTGVNADLAGTTYKHAETFVGAVNFVGGVPAGQSAAVRFGQSGVEVAIDGWGKDPVGH